MDGPEVTRTLARIAHQIAERPNRAGRLALVGIHTRGVPMAQRLVEQIAAISGARPDLGVLDIALVRHAVAEGTVAVPVISHVDLDFPVGEREVVIVDDVICTRRTVQAALEAVFDAGRPLIVQLVALIDRGHGELPIGPDYVGRELVTAREEHVQVRLTELDGEDEVLISRQA